MGKSILDVILENENDIESASVAEMKRILDVVETPAPPQIQKIKPLLLQKGEYELYEFLDYCVFLEVRNKNADGWYRTAAVRPTSDKIEFYYDKEFIEKLGKNPGKLIFLIAHEASHILRFHIDRTKKAKHHGGLANIAQDMVINHDILSTQRIGGFTPEMIEGGVTLPEEFIKKHSKDDIYYEKVYNWIISKQKNKEKSEEKSKSSNKEVKIEVGSIVKVKSGPNKGEYRRVTKVNNDGTVETEIIDINKEIEKIKGKK